MFFIKRQWTMIYYFAQYIVERVTLFYLVSSIFIFLITTIFPVERLSVSTMNISCQTDSSVPSRQKVSDFSLCFITGVQYCYPKISLFFQIFLLYKQNACCLQVLHYLFTFRILQILFFREELQFYGNNY